MSPRFTVPQSFTVKDNKKKQPKVTTAKLYSSSSSWTVINLSALELLLNELKSWLFCVRSMLHDLWRAPSIQWLQNAKQPVIRDLTCSVVSLWRIETAEVVVRIHNYITIPTRVRVKDSINPLYFFMCCIQTKQMRALFKSTTRSPRGWNANVHYAVTSKVP